MVRRKAFSAALASLLAGGLLSASLAGGAEARPRSDAGDWAARTAEPREARGDEGEENPSLDAALGIAPPQVSFCCSRPPRLTWPAADLHAPKPAAPGARGCGGAGGSTVSLLFPRGDVRPSDLDAWALEVDVERFVAHGSVVFRRAGRTLAAVRDFNPPRRNTREALPASLRAEIAVGDVVTWGWLPNADDPAGVPETAVFRVVEAGPADADDGARSRAHDAVPAVAPGRTALVRVEALRRRGLRTAAFRAAYALARETPADRRAWGLVLRVLEDWEQVNSTFRNDAASWVAGYRSPPSLEPRGR